MSWDKLNAGEIAKAIGCREGNVIVSWPYLVSALESLGLLTDRVAIAALATIRVECPTFTPMRELGTPERHCAMYDGRKDLGNCQLGDGAKYCGRGFIQITGRANYAFYGQQLGVDLIEDPDEALEINTAAAIFAVYFKIRRVALAADQADWVKVRKLVNGGTNGLQLFLTCVQKLQAAIDAKVAAKVTIQ